MDLLGWASVLSAALATAGAFAAARRERTTLALALVLATAAALRANLAWYAWLGAWDERYHALVARHLMEHPLVPTLVEHPLVDVGPGRWTQSHLWLHKPPLALWLMAGAMRVLGPGEFTLRVPSLVLGTAAVACTYVLARAFLGRTESLVAAAFHAWYGRGALVGGGLRPTDHIDAILWVLVGLGACIAAWTAVAAGERRKRTIRFGTLAVGVVFGLAWLTKEWPALVIVAFFAFCLVGRRASWTVSLAAPAAALAVGMLIALPWTLYIAREFPADFAFASRSGSMRFSQAVEGHGGSWTFYLARMPVDCGPLVWLVLVVFAATAVTSRRDLLPLLGWIVLTYAAFSAAATKMDNYVLIALPAVFCAYGWFVVQGLARGRLMAAAAVLVCVTFLGHALITAHQPWLTGWRTEPWAQEVEFFAHEADALGAGPWVVFNSPPPIESMFRVPVTAVPAFPDDDLLARARERGLRVAVYGVREEMGGDGPWASDPAVRWLPVDPRVAAERTLVTRLRRLGTTPLLIYDPNGAPTLKRYLERNLWAEVRAGLPVRDPVLERLLQRGGRLVVLDGDLPAASSERLRHEFPEVVVMPTPRVSWREGRLP
jgi:4-amino-4-deoxy-L-arabinose transferase-like glycosyltransferase